MRGISVVVAVASAGCNLFATSADDAPDAAVVRPPLGTGASTLAGWAEAGDVDGPRASNLFDNPVGVAVAADGRVLVADFENGKLRAVDATGTASTVFGDPRFTRPFALAVAGTTTYVGTDNDPVGGHGAMTGTLWKIDAAGVATVVAPGIGRPRGIAVLADGRLAVADYTHHVIELVDPNTGVVSPLAGVWDDPGLADGLGGAARFSIPYAIAVRGDGTLLVTDQGNHRLRAITLDGEVTTLPAVIDQPQGLAIAATGDVYVSDLTTSRILRVRGGTVDPVAGDGQAGYRDDVDPLAARFFGLEGIALSADGATLYVADGTRGEAVPYNRIRSVTLPR